MVIAPSQPVGAAQGEAGQQENRQPAQNEEDVGHPMLPWFGWAEHGRGLRKAAIWKADEGVKRA